MPAPDIFDRAYPTLKVGLCQVLTQQWDVEGNFARALESIRQAAALGAEIAITPECVLHGYGFDGKPDYHVAIREVAEPADGEKIKIVQELCRNLSIDVVIGYVERGENNAVHNSASLISRDGRTVYTYRKIHCRNFESSEHTGAFVPGERFHAATLPYASGDYTIGTMICFDREIPETVRCLRALGSQLIACPLATDTYDASAWSTVADNELITRARAAENEVFIAVVNHAGRQNGGSVLVGPGGHFLHQMGPEPGVHVHEIPIGALTQNIHAEPWGWMGWGYRRPQVYDRYLAAESREASAALITAPKATPPPAP